MSAAGFDKLAERMTDAHLGIHRPGPDFRLRHEFLQPLQPFGTDGRLIGRQRFFKLMHEELVHDMHGGDGGTVERGTAGGLAQGVAARGREVDRGDDVVELFHGGWLD